LTSQIEKEGFEEAEKVRKAKEEEVHKHALSSSIIHIESSRLLFSRILTLFSAGGSKSKRRR